MILWGWHGRVAGMGMVQDGVDGRSVTMVPSESTPSSSIALALSDFQNSRILASATI